jgi:hypothetical protein
MFLVIVCRLHLRNRSSNTPSSYFIVICALKHSKVLNLTLRREFQAKSKECSKLRPIDDDRGKKRDKRHFDRGCQNEPHQASTRPKRELLKFFKAKQLRLLFFTEALGYANSITASIICFAVVAIALYILHLAQWPTQLSTQILRMVLRECFLTFGPSTAIASCLLYRPLRSFYYQTCCGFESSRRCPAIRSELWPTSYRSCGM